MRTLTRVISILTLSLIVSLGISAQTDLTTLDGGRVNIEGDTGKVVVLAIGATWLPLSARQAEITNTLAKNYAGKDVVVYFVATDSLNAKSKNFASSEVIAKFATQNRLSVKVLRDPDGAGTLKKFKVEQVPSFVILDKSGNQIGTPFGGIDPKSDASIPLSRVIDKAL